MRAFTLLLFVVCLGMVALCVWAAATYPDDWFLLAVCAIANSFTASTARHLYYRIERSLP